MVRVRNFENLRVGVRRAVTGMSGGFRRNLEGAPRGSTTKSMRREICPSSSVA